MGEVEGLRKEIELYRKISVIKQEVDDLDKVLKTILEACNEIIGFDRSRIYLLSDDKKYLMGVMATGIKDFNKVCNPVQNDHVIKTIFQKQKADIFLTQNNDPHLEILNKTKNMPFAAMPLKVKDNVIGMICADNIDSDKEITKDDLYQLTFFAYEAASAIDNAKLYSKLKRFNQKLKEKVEQKTRRLKNANKKLQDSNNAKLHMMNVVTHELKTPLTSIIGYGELMLNGRMGPLNDIQQSSLKIVVDESHRLTRMINHFLDISKMEAGKLVISKTKTDLKEIIQKTIDLLSANAKTRNISFDIISKGNTQIDIDKDRITQVLTNTIGNSLKYTKEGDKIVIGIEEFDDKLVVKIEDHGPGIAKEHLNRIFEKFYRVNKTEGSSKGTGLGLAISKEIIKQHGGNIWVESELGKGTTFFFSIGK